MADVPQDLVAGGVEQGVQRDRDLARAEVGAEVTADLTDRVDQEAADLLGNLLQLLLGEAVEVLRAVNAVEDGHELRVKMKSVICSSSGAPAPAVAVPSAACAAPCDSAAIPRAPASP